MTANIRIIRLGDGSYEDITDIDAQEFEELYATRDYHVLEEDLVQGALDACLTFASWAFGGNKDDEGNAWLRRASMLLGELELDVDDDLESLL